MDQLAAPGQRLADRGHYLAGQGTYELADGVFASVVGVVNTTAATDGKKGTVEVIPEKQTSIVPSIGDVVTGRVTKVNARLATVDILSVGQHLVKEPFPGTIRQRDVRAFDVDAVEIYSSFRPGDIVRAQVISLGDVRSYYLTTAKNELGVILAQSATGHTMVPISWEQMQDERGTKEPRKVAKIDD